MQINNSGLQNSIQLHNQASQKLSKGNIIEGSVDSISAEASFKANIKVIQAKDEILGTLLDLKA
ncbi:MAG: hypothetical protein COB02_13585 [Candidatus Cloacimonadota bacterium]|nr:MAG: hypothetical protein COB02_13585 [Candidatus Cloacimonadota bacterium]